MTEALFVETREYQRFQEFCEACRTYQYIGLCYGFSRTFDDEALLYANCCCKS